jgi:hypothetical protein
MFGYLVNLPVKSLSDSNWNDFTLRRSMSIVEENGALAEL